MSAIDLFLLITLGCRVRGLSVCQFARLVGLTEARAWRRAQRLARAGLVRLVRMLVAEPPPMCGPVCVWHPGEPTPDLASVAYRLQSRVVCQASFRWVVVVTPTAARLIGGTQPNLGRPFQMSHDLAVGSAFEWFMQHEPERAERFVSEDFRRCRLKTPTDWYIPDAVILSHTGEVAELVEGGGPSYDTARLEKLHACAVAHQTPWRIF